MHTVLEKKNIVEECYNYLTVNKDIMLIKAECFIRNIHSNVQGYKTPDLRSGIYSASLRDTPIESKPLRCSVVLCITFIMLVFSPITLRAQVVGCKKTEIKKTKTERWEKVKYGLRVFEFKDSTLLRETIQILSLKPKDDSIPVDSKNVKSILVMRFEQGGGDTITCHVSYLEKPFIYDELKGCCLISGYYVQIEGIIPFFLTPTKEVATFSYLSHKFNMGNYGGVTWELEDMGDDSLPQWKLIFSEKKVRLLEYRGIDSKWDSNSDCRH